MNPQPARSARMRWADVAKGACIVLVVLHHVVTKHFDAVTDGWWVAAWANLSHGLKPVRMPLFFVLSGFFAARAVTRPWTFDGGRRVLSPAYLYVVWLLISFAIFSFERDLPMNRTQDLGELAHDLVFASTGMWFLYALAVYFVLVRLTLRVPTSVVLTVAAAVAAGTWLLGIEEINRTSVLVHFVFFAVGARAPDAVRRIAEDPRPLTVPMLSAYVVGVILLNATGTPTSLEIVLLSLVGVPLGLRLAALAVSHLPRTSDGLAWLGRRTLPIYVLHVPVLAVVHHLVPGVPGDAFALAYPLVVTALVVATTLGLHRVLLGLGLRPLFALPRRTASVVPVPARRVAQESKDAA